MQIVKREQHARAQILVSQVKNECVHIEMMLCPPILLYNFEIVCAKKKKKKKKLWIEKQWNGVAVQRRERDEHSY